MGASRQSSILIVNIFSLYILQTKKQTKFRGICEKKIHGFSKFSKNRILLETHFRIFNKPFLRSRVVPQKIWARTVQPS